MEKSDPIEEALRYVDNARRVLNESGHLNVETGRYEDNKYVKAAGHYLWHSSLIVLDAVFQVKTKSRPHPDVKDYLNAIGNRDRKLLESVVDGYQIMHITMGYDGNRIKRVCEEGFRLANSIIDRCALMLPKAA